MVGEPAHTALKENIFNFYNILFKFFLQFIQQFKMKFPENPLYL